MRTLTWAGVIGITAAAGLRCSKPSVERVDALVTVGQTTLTRAQLEGQLRAQPDFVRARYSTPERKQGFLDTVIRNQLLIDEAKRRGLEKDAEVQAGIDRLLVQQLLAQESRVGAPTEADAKAYYDAHPQEFSRPERARVALIWRPKASSPDGAELKAIAGKLSKLAPADRATAFAEGVRGLSMHEGSKGQDGDLGPRSHEELLQQFGEAVATAVGALAEPGALSPVVEAPEGWALLRLLGRQPGETRPFDVEKGPLLARLTSEHRTKQVDALVRSLKERTPVTIAPGAVDKLDFGAPSGPLLP